MNGEEFLKRSFIRLEKNKKIWLSVIATLTVIIGVAVSAVIMAKPPATVSGIGDIARGDVSLGRVNILAAGRDRASGLYDSLMLIGFDRDRGSICVLQIPRDTYAEFTSGSYKKINGAVASLGGMDGLVSFLEESLGIDIDGYLSFDLEAVSEVVDAIGGVEVDVPEDMYYEDRDQGLSISLESGIRNLNGKEAEMLIRYRSGYARGDIERLDTQKLFLKALINKVKDTSSLSLLLELLPTLDSIGTNIPLSKIATVAYEAERVATENIVFRTLPGDSAVATSSGAWYYVLRKGETEKILEKYFGCGEFDPLEVFLNDKYVEFEEIYRGDR